MIWSCLKITKVRKPNLWSPIALWTLGLYSTVFGCIQLLNMIIHSFGSYPNWRRGATCQTIAVFLHDPESQSWIFWRLSEAEAAHWGSPTTQLQCGPAWRDCENNVLVTLKSCFLRLPLEVGRGSGPGSIAQRGPHNGSCRTVQRAPEQDRARGKQWGWRITVRGRMRRKRTLHSVRVSFDISVASILQFAASSVASIRLPSKPQPTLILCLAGQASRRPTSCVQIIHWANAAQISSRRRCRKVANAPTPRCDALREGTQTSLIELYDWPLRVGAGWGLPAS